MDDPAARAFQERFAAFAAEHLDLLRQALTGAAEADQRAIAAAVIGYALNKQDVVNDLQAALQDPDESVRANAIRALNAFVVAGVRVSPTWLVELLNSVVLGDRVEAVRTLLTLTDKPAPDVVELIRERALSSLVEMARWKTPRYALPPFLLVGRLAGLADDETQASWKKGDREKVIGQASGAPVRKRPAALK
jgi:HEAT repeat protein